MRQPPESTFQTDKLMVGILIIALSGVALTEVIRKIEKRFEKWRPDFKG
jgi:NitT/TauT family transport system permease protein